MSRGWYDDIYSDIIREWKNFIIENSYEDEGDEVDKEELLEDFKNSDINISFTIDNLDAFDLLEIQKFLIKKGVNHNYLFNIMDIENYVVDKILDEFEG
jgi:hypothetical protein